MKNKLSTVLYVTLLVVGIGLTFFSSAQESGLVIEGNDYLWVDTTELLPQELIDIAANVTPRAVIEYSDWALGPDLYAPDINITYPVLTASNRVVVEYADFVSGSIMRLTPDVSRNGIVDIIDVFTVARAFNTKPGQSMWNPTADLDVNEWVNIIDVFVVAKEFKKTQIENFVLDP